MYNSVMLFEIGVPVANVMPFPPPGQFREVLSSVFVNFFRKYHTFYKDLYSLQKLQNTYKYAEK